jgi:hypothetical protein
MTPEERELGFPRSVQATHTEFRAVTQYPLEPGETMEIDGFFEPCSTCKGAMNNAASSSGGQIFYNWPEGRWAAGR